VLCCFLPSAIGFADSFLLQFSLGVLSWKFRGRGTRCKLWLWMMSTRSVFAQYCKIVLHSLFCQLFWVFRLISSSNIWVFVSLSYYLSFYGFSCGSFEQFNENFYLWFHLLNIRLGLGFFSCGPPLNFFALLQ
jgi:hypothetical protein